MITGIILELARLVLDKQRKRKVAAENGFCFCFSCNGEKQIIKWTSYFIYVENKLPLTLGN